MNRKYLALLIPPAAVMKFGCATCTAAPIGVFWLTSLVGLGYVLTGGVLGAYEQSRWIILGLSVILWLIAAVWARVVISGVHEDLHPGAQGSLDRRVEPHPDEPDPLKEARGMHH